MGKAINVALLRHGKTAGNLLDVYCGSGYDGGVIQEDLDRIGTTALAKRIRTVEWSMAIHSNQRRSAESLHAIWEGGYVPPAIDEDPLLNEIKYGAWEGKTQEEVARQYPADFERFLIDPCVHGPTDGETLLGVLSRATRFLRVIEIEAHGVSDDTFDVLCVSHKTFNRCLLGHLLGIPMKCAKDIRQANWCLNRIAYRDSEWSVQSVNETLDFSF